MISSRQRGKELSANFANCANAGRGGSPGIAAGHDRTTPSQPYCPGSLDRPARSAPGQSAGGLKPWKVTVILGMTVACGGLGGNWQRMGNESADEGRGGLGGMRSWRVEALTAGVEADGLGLVSRWGWLRWTNFYHFFAGKLNNSLVDKIQVYLIRLPVQPTPR